VENYEEPNGKKQRSTASFPSVLIALVALAVIAFVGWKLLQPPPAPPVPPAEKPVATPTPASSAETPTAGAELATNTEDPICGMDPQRSAFADGTLLAFDSLACYYQYVEKDAKSAAVRERVVAYDTYKNAAPVLLDFSDAVWLIGLGPSAPKRTRRRPWAISADASPLRRR